MLSVFSLLWLTFATFRAVPPPQPTPAPTMQDVAYLMGRFEPSTHPDFVLLDLKYASEDKMYLRRDAFAAFLKMNEQARRDGILLRIVSATRNFARQREIWENKWSGKTLVAGKNLATTIPDPTERARKILTYSSMPSTSRHHWGTDIDLNSVDPKYFNTTKGSREYAWLVKNAPTFGFGQPYTAKNTYKGKTIKAIRTGYEEEKWHWSYLPVSKILLANYAAHIKDTNISGFSGAETAVAIGMVANYVGGVHDSCKQ